MATERALEVVGAKPRLDSWKEIASHLRRSPRTVRRWERHEGLPVHRHRHGKQSTIYGFVHEIDVWLKGRSVAGGRVPTPPVHVSEPTAQTASDASPKAPAAKPLVIAVLPLRNLDGDHEQERFADGLTEELVSQIGHCCPDLLRVIALTSVIQYKQSPKAIGEIGRELGVDHILEGGIRRYGQRVRLTARLIAARDQAHIWADTYEVRLPPVFTFQQTLAQQLTDSLVAELHTAARKGRSRATPRTAEAHNAYLEAKSHFLLAEGDIKKSIESLSLAIERDPSFAPSYCELALNYFRRLVWDYPPIVVLRRIEEFASQALKLDPKLARAHSMWAAFHLLRTRNWSKAEASSRRAIELNPSDPWARIIRSAYHLVVGGVQEAFEELGRVREVDPQSRETGMWLAIFAYFARRYDLAIEHCRELLQLDPSASFIHIALALSLAQTGEYATAISHAEKAVELSGGSISQTARACSIYALAGERDTAQRLLAELVAATETEYTRYILLAQASACLGKNQQTLEWLEKAYDQHDHMLVFLKTDPRFDPLSGLPRFRKLLRRIGLPR
jgi:serine/threonine-protein kinase